MWDGVDSKISLCDDQIEVWRLYNKFVKEEELNKYKHLSRNNQEQHVKIKKKRIFGKKLNVSQR